MDTRKEENRNAGPTEEERNPNQQTDELYTRTGSTEHNDYRIRGSEGSNIIQKGEPGNSQKDKMDPDTAAPEKTE